MLVVCAVQRDHQRANSRDEMVGNGRVTSRVKRLVDCVFKQSKVGLDLTRLQKYIRHLEAELLTIRSSNGKVRQSNTNTHHKQ